MAGPLSRTKEYLVGRIVSVATNTSHYDYPRYGMTLEDAWTQLQADVKDMRKKLGDQRTDQLLDMCDQAQSHYRQGYAKSPSAKPAPGQHGAEDIKLGTRLMQDIEWIVRGREPFAYPKELYRWPLVSGSRTASDPDFARDFTEEE